MKIGIIGFGAIGFDVAKKLDQEKDQFNVIGVHSRTKNKIIRLFLSEFPIPSNDFLMLY